MHREEKQPTWPITTTLIWSMGPLLKALQAVSLSAPNTMLNSKATQYNNLLPRI